MRQLRDGVTKLARFAVDYIDLVIAVGLAVYASYASAFLDLKSDALSQVTIALLGVLAIVIFRERWERARIVRDVAQSLDDRSSSKQWRVLEAKLSWDLAESGMATATTVKHLRFEQDEVFAIYEFSARPVGTVVNHTCEARRGPDEAFRDLPIIHRELPGPNGRKYHVISLERMVRRGDRMEVRTVRELEGFFNETRENVSIDVEIPTDSMILSVSWASSRKPQELTLERSNRTPEVIDVRRLKSRAGYRVTHVERISDPLVGEKITLSWIW